MSIPYQNTTAGSRAIDDIQKILRTFGCTKFANGTDFGSGDVFIQFEHRGRPVQLKASAKGYAAAYLKENPWSRLKQSNRQQWEAKALEIGHVAVFSILRDWVKAQVTAIEIGVMSFEAAFLSHILLADGRSFIETAMEQKMLPAPTKEDDDG